jgi:hypothetical protein
MDINEWNPARLVGVSGSYWQAFALHAGIKLEVFTRIGDEEISAEEVAGRLECEVRSTTMLLNALAAMGLLVKKQDQYANTYATSSYLVKDSPNYTGHLLMHHHHLVKSWSRLDQAVKSGRPVGKRSSYSKEERESFLMGMFNLAMGIAPHLAEQVDLCGRSHLLDLGGGPGTYAIHFCLANPDLEATVYDLPTTRPFAERTIAQFGLSNRVEFVAGNYAENKIEGAYDVAWLSQILHGEGPEACQMIIDKAVSAMKGGGLLLVHEFILNNTCDGPLFPALFSLNMLVNTEAGQSYTEDQIKGMLANAGLQNIQRLAFQGPNNSGIITGES